MNPDRTLNEGVMNEQSSLKFLWEVPYVRMLLAYIKNQRLYVSHYILYMYICMYVR